MKRSFKSKKLNSNEPSLKRRKKQTRNGKSRAIQSFVPSNFDNSIDERACTKIKDALCTFSWKKHYPFVLPVDIGKEIALYATGTILKCPDPDCELRDNEILSMHCADGSEKYLRWYDESNSGSSTCNGEGKSPLETCCNDECSNLLFCCKGSCIYCDYDDFYCAECATYFEGCEHYKCNDHVDEDFETSKCESCERKICSDCNRTSPVEYSGYGRNKCCIEYCGKYWCDNCIKNEKMKQCSGGDWCPAFFCSKCNFDFLCKECGTGFCENCLEGGACEGSGDCVQCGGSICTDCTYYSVHKDENGNPVCRHCHEKSVSQENETDDSDIA